MAAFGRHFFVYQAEEQDKIFVQGWVKVSEADLETAVPAASNMMIETVKESDCLHYSFAKDNNETGLIHICERWEDEDSLNTHFQTAHMTALNEAISGLSISGMDVCLYSGDEVRVMMQS